MFIKSLIKLDLLFYWQHPNVWKISNKDINIYIYIYIYRERERERERESCRHITVDLFGIMSSKYMYINIHKDRKTYDIWNTWYQYEKSVIILTKNTI